MRTSVGEDVRRDRRSSPPSPPSCSPSCATWPPTTTASGSRPTRTATSPRSRSPRWRSSRTSACACPRSAATSSPTPAPPAARCSASTATSASPRTSRPTRPTLGIQFRHARSRDVHAPGFYLHLEPGRVFMACGTWRPDRETLHAIRTAIAARPGRWQAIVEDPAFAEHFRLGGRVAQTPAGGLRPRSPADRGAQAQGLHRRRRPDRGRRHRPRFPRPLPRAAAARPASFMRFLCDGARVSY